jgi:hypothetical protein
VWLGAECKEGRLTAIGPFGVRLDIDHRLLSDEVLLQVQIDEAQLTRKAVVRDNDSS